MVVAASSCVDDEGLSMRHTNIVLPKSPLLTPVAAEKLISVSLENRFKFADFVNESHCYFRQDPV